MKVFLILTLMAVAAASPEAGYPSSRYGPPEIVPSTSSSYTYSTLSPGYNYAPPSPAEYPINYNSAPTGGYDYSAPSHQEPHVHKHIYVHLAPEEPEPYAPRQQVPLPPPQRHYKIVFIKAPTPPTPTAPSVQLPPQDEEKTLIYVLVKKPEEQPDIRINAPPPTAPSKPEVFFIKYKPQSNRDLSDDAIVTEPRTPDTSYGPPLAPKRPAPVYGAP